MKIISVDPKDKEEFNRLSPHPLQSWEWGEFRKKTGIEVIRLGRYDKDKLLETAQITIHPLPFTRYTIGYFPKSNIPSQEMLEKLTAVGKQYNCIFIKLEPNITIENFKFQSFPHQLATASAGSRPTAGDPASGGTNFKLINSPHPLFTKYTFQLDLTKSEEELMKNMHHKTRYNIRVAQKHQVVVKEDNSDEAFATYFNLLAATTKRQKFYAHNRRYHKLLWETLKPAGIAHLLTANYQIAGKNHILAAWIVFLFNDVLYYPYGASSDQLKNIMASNLVMWEAIRFGKKHGAKIFDLWGSLGPNLDPSDPWYGFHRFKQGYGPKLIEFIGSYDLIINPNLYKFYNLVHKTRETFLKIKSNF